MRRVLHPSRSIIICVAAALLAGPAAALSTYHVGNSLTNDAGLVSAGLDDVAVALFVARTGGYHVRGNTPLRDHVANPSASGALFNPTVGRWPDAFANTAFDAVTFQPWTQATALDEADALETLITTLHASPLNTHAAVYVYTGWPAVGGNPFPTVWNTAFATVGPTTTWPRRDQAVEWIVNEVAARTGTPIGVVPVGDVLAALDRRLRAGEVPGLTSAWSLYRDQFHLNTAGSYVAALTMMTTLAGADPRGSALRGVYANVDPAFAAIAQEEVWHAVRAQPRPMVIPEPVAGTLLIVVTGAARRRPRRVGAR